MLSLRKLTKISRPHFWLYTAWPFLIGVSQTGLFSDLHQKYMAFLVNHNTQGIIILSLVLLLFLAVLDYFVFGANLFIYWINDIADKDTDQRNEKKGSYEVLLKKQEVHQLWQSIKNITIADLIIILLLFLIVVFAQSSEYSHASNSSLFKTFMVTLWSYVQHQGWILIILFTAFFLTSIYYSRGPIRAKARLYRDGIFNVLYILPWLIGYVMFGGERSMINRWGFFAWWLRCMAMHAFSAIPDIHADKKAWLHTTAVVLGKTRSIEYCGLLRAWAAILAFPLLGLWSFVFFSCYFLMLLGSYKSSIVTIYRWFPLLNGMVGFILFRLLLPS